MRPMKFIPTLFALSLALAANEARASYPAGVWVKVKKVVFEPDATNPTKIQIHGAAMLYDKSTGTSYTGYTEPAFGFLYYSCPAGKEKTCVSEWADVEKNIKATDDVCVGLGDQSLPTGTLRAPNATPTKPDEYPIAMGVLTGYVPCQVIEKFLNSQPDGGTGGAGGTGGTGGSTSSGGSTSTGGAAGSGSGGASTGGAAGSGSGGASTGGASAGGASSGGTSSGGASSGGTGSGDDSSDDGGCTVSAPSSVAGFGWLLAALGAAFALRRGKRG
ncbi:MAG: hypothetical protein HYZ29_27970 [Myxococcales bacterium]|nr:hypothetical protein [Myxococcales bacterium]